MSVKIKATLFIYLKNMNKNWNKRYASFLMDNGKLIVFSKIKL